jgi:lysophospholipase L1-like esterase
MPHRAAVGALIALAGATVCATGSATPTPTAPATGSAWTSTWNAALDHGQSVGPWQDQTLRMVVHASLGGTQLRIHLSNVFATSTAQFAHVSVAPQLNQAQTVGTPTAVTFAGSASVTLAPGGTAVSDPVALPTTAGERLLVSLFIPPGADITSANMHTYADETEYNIIGSDATGVANPGVSNTFSFTSYLDGVDVDASGPQTIVAVGDSITDGVGGGGDTDTRWPDYLGRRVAPSGLAVIDQGISGNWVTEDQGGNGGPSLTNRWQRDALNQPGVKDIVDADGINDLRGGVSAAALESAQASLIASAHTAGLKIFLTTITPCAGASNCGSSFETARQAYNAWVRAGSSGADGWFDFDAAIDNGSALAGLYDSGDHIHPNSAGSLMLASIVNTGAL